MSKILVALSGGVDSAITALRLKKAGFDVIGCYMMLHDNINHFENLKKVQKIVSYLDIKYETLDLKEQFLNSVYKNFVETYKSGRTPNPCILCNKNIKFGALIEYAKKIGCEKIATGHYAKIKNGFICEAKDKSKDQSYFLSKLPKDVLDFIVFPLGDSLKEEVKNEALQIAELNLFATQKESNEICFVDTTYIDILKQHTNVEQEGKVLDKKGNIIGSHKGYMQYTIGKRRGFEVRGALTPYYVLNIDPIENTIIVGSSEDLEKMEFSVSDLNLFTDENKFEAEVKIRYKSAKIPCEIVMKDKIANVKLYHSIKGVAPGQRAVFYRDDAVIASGEIL